MTVQTSSFCNRLILHFHFLFPPFISVADDFSVLSFYRWVPPLMIFLVSSIKHLHCCHSFKFILKAIKLIRELQSLLSLYNRLILLLIVHYVHYVFTNNVIMQYNFYGITSNLDIIYSTDTHYITWYSLLNLHLTLIFSIK